MSATVLVVIPKSRTGCSKYDCRHIRSWRAICHWNAQDDTQLIEHKALTIHADMPSHSGNIEILAGNHIFIVSFVDFQQQFLVCGTPVKLTVKSQRVHAVCDVLLRARQPQLIYCSRQ